MNTQELLTQLEDQGVILVPKDGRLRIDAPSGVITDQLRQVLRESKPEILALLETRQGWPPGSGDARRHHDLLRPYIDKPVLTPFGRGRLILAAPERAAVLLDRAPSRATYFLPTEVRPPDTVPRGEIYHCTVH